jgi:hypothetical protein
MSEASPPFNLLISAIESLMPVLLLKLIHKAITKALINARKIKISD